MQRGDASSSEARDPQVLETTRTILRNSEQSGAEPRQDVYVDGKGIPTTATGLAIDNAHKKYANEVISEGLGISTDEANTLRESWLTHAGDGTSVMQADDAQNIESAVVQREINTVRERIDAKEFDALAPHQIATLVSLHVNGVFGTNLKDHINSGDLEEAYHEIRERSCAERSRPGDPNAFGLQLRREREAHFFRTGEWISDGRRAAALLVENTSNQDFLTRCDHPLISDSKEFREWARGFNSPFNVELPPVAVAAPSDTGGRPATESTLPFLGVPLPNLDAPPTLPLAPPPPPAAAPTPAIAINPIPVVVAPPGPPPPGPVAPPPPPPAAPTVGVFIANNGQAAGVQISIPIPCSIQ